MKEMVKKEDRTRAGITGAFGEMIMVEEWWRFAKKGDFVWVSIEVCISTQ